MLKVIRIFYTNPSITIPSFTLITCKSIVLVNLMNRKSVIPKLRKNWQINILTFHISLTRCSPRLFAVLRRLKLTFLGITADHYFSFPIPHSPFPIPRFSNIRRRRHLEKLPFAEIIFLLEIRRVRISGVRISGFHYWKLDKMS